MRPFRLVGVSEPFCEWQDFRKDDQFLSSLKNKETRKFYEKQNDLIDRYSEIDRILETGFQIDMLREYGSDLREIHDNITYQSNQKLQPGPPSATDVTKSWCLVKVFRIKSTRSLRCSTLRIPANIND